ncbi:MAG TPA: hypothetical protein VLM84_13205, partial [Chromatiaceae bacterium]|nr:hypothetical protein [Chromatiaceae bacterium]
RLCLGLLLLAGLGLSLPPPCLPFRLSRVLTPLRFCRCLGLLLLTRLGLCRDLGLLSARRGLRLYPRAGRTILALSPLLQDDS